MSEEMKAVNGAVDSLNRAFEEFKSTNDAKLKELEAKGSADPLLEEKLARIEANLDAAQKVADEAALAVKRQSRIVTDQNGAQIDMDAKALHWARGIAKKRGTDVVEFGSKEMDAYKTAFNSYLRKEERTLSSDEIKALSVGSDADGGYVVHPDLTGRIVQSVFETSPMRAYAAIQVISTSELEGLHDLEEAAAGWVAETGARAATATPQIAKWTIATHEIYAKPQATQKILDDGEINMEAWLASKVADKFARVESAAFVSGSGSGQPKGFLSYTAGTTLPDEIEQIITGADGAFAGAGAGADVLISALYGLKQQYRMNATWFMNRATTALVRKLKDSDGAYIWTPGIAAGQPATLLGYPVASFEDMPDPATDSLSIAVGDMREAYQIVDRMGIRTLRDPYSAKPYVEFYTTKRVGGAVINAEAIKIIKFAAP